MATRSSARKHKAPTRLEDPTPKRKSNEVTLGKAQMQEIVNQITSSVLEKLQSADKSKKGDDVAEVAVDHTQINLDEERSGALDAVQGSVSNVLDRITNGELREKTIVENKSVDKPESDFISNSMPLGSRVPQKIKTKIMANEYVDFGSLISNNMMNGENSYQLCFNEANGSGSGLSTITIEPKIKARKILNIDMWTSAFQIFVSIYTERHASESPALMKYSNTIRDLAVRGFNWLFYDESFRYLRQGDPDAYPWGSIHSELWIRSQPISGGNNGIRPTFHNKVTFDIPNDYGNDEGL